MRCFSAIHFVPFLCLVMHVKQELPNTLLREGLHQHPLELPICDMATAASPRNP